MTQKDDPELVTTGPYHSIRHPIYSGILLAMIGTAIVVEPVLAGGRPPTGGPTSSLAPLWRNASWPAYFPLAARSTGVLLRCWFRFSFDLRVASGPSASF